LTAAISLLQVVYSPGAVHYVNINGTHPTLPYTGWSTAATDIQDAVDASTNGDLILVTNGVYQTGSRADEYGVSNRVAITKAVTVESVNGPAVSIIQGDHVFWIIYPYISSGTDVRCVYLTNGATLSGFTLTNAASTGNGGGAFCESNNAILNNCLIVSNSTASGGGGVYSGTLIGCSISNNISTGYGTGGGVSGGVLTNCILNNNSAYIGGGAESSTLYNCIVSGNSGYGGSDNSTLNNCTVCYNLNWGAYNGTLNNCVLYGNLGLAALSSTLNNCTVSDNPGGGPYDCTANNCLLYYNSGGNYSGATLNYCCTTPLPIGGTGNITNEPQMASLSHLSAGSPCIGAGSAAYTNGLDIDGEAWANPPSIGCDEYHPGAVTGPLNVSIQADNTNVGPGFAVNFTAQISGRTSASRWIFDDGTVISNLPFTSHSWLTVGNHIVLLRAYNESYPAGVTSTQVVQVIKQFYVNINNSNPTPPYTNWATAATSIQDAIDAAYPGGTILVSNGVYQTGGHVAQDNAMNRVAVTKPLAIIGINGPSVTTIYAGNNTYEYGTRCVYLANGAMLSGFTLSGGLIGFGTGQGFFGGGVNAGSAVVSNCIITGNSIYAKGQGGGIYGGTLIDCTISGNSTPENENVTSIGGGACSSTLINCIISGNSCGGYGGGAYGCTLNNCTVIGNSALVGGGTAYCTVNNSIVYFNSNNSVYGPYPNYDNASFLNSCTTPDPAGIGDIIQDPLFVNPAAGDFHLQTNSPCINSGNNTYVSVTNDLDGNPRIVGGTVDIGAYEYQTPTSIISYAWLQQYGLPTDGSVDHADLDGNGMNVYQDWIAGLNPTNALSVLKMLSPSPTNSPPGLVVSWQSVSNITYYLQSSTNLAAHPAFSTIQSNIVGQAGTTSYTDTTATNSGPYFYRVGVQ